MIYDILYSFRLKLYHVYRMYVMYCKLSDMYYLGYTILYTVHRKVYTMCYVAYTLYYMLECITHL